MADEPISTPTPPTTDPLPPMDYEDPRPLSVGEFNRALYAMRDRASLRRNGHSFGGWIAKLITPERFLLVLVVVFTGYGEWRDLKAGLYAGKADTAALKVTVDHLTTQVDQQGTAQTTFFHEVRSTLDEHQNLFATKQDFADVQAGIALRPTRKEFEEFQRSVLPALRRIEQKVGDSR